MTHSNDTRKGLLNSIMMMMHPLIVIEKPPRMKNVVANRKKSLTQMTETPGVHVFAEKRTRKVMKSSGYSVDVVLRVESLRWIFRI